MSGSIICSCSCAYRSDNRVIFTLSVRKRFSRPLKLPILQPLSAVICRPHSAARPHRASYCVSAVGAQSPRMPHLSGAVVGSSYPTSLPLPRHTEVLFYPENSRVCAAKYCQPSDNKGERAPGSSLRRSSARQRCDVKIHSRKLEQRLKVRRRWCHWLRMMM